MTRKETLQIMSILKAAYPAYYKDLSRSESESVVGLWSAMFAQDDYRVVSLAVRALLETDVKGYPPHIGAVKAKMHQIMRPADRTPAEAWALVESAAGNSAYEAEKEYDGLPPIIKRLVGSPSQLREWAQMDAVTFRSVVGSNFQRSYKEAVEREKELEKLPQDIRQMVQRLADRSRLEIGDGEHGA